MLLKTIQKFNKTAVTREMINSDEVAAIRFLCHRDKPFLTLVKKAWGMDQREHTAVPLVLLSAPYLCHSADLPVDQKTNPMWFGILTPSNKKYELWIRRAIGKFESKAPPSNPHNLNVALSRKLNSQHFQLPGAANHRCWQGSEPQKFRTHIQGSRVGQGTRLANGLRVHCLTPHPAGPPRC
jgi:hypothetical protein